MFRPLLIRPSIEKPSRRLDYRFFMDTKEEGAPINPNLPRLLHDYRQKLNREKGPGRIKKGRMIHGLILLQDFAPEFKAKISNILESATSMSIEELTKEIEAVSSEIENHLRDRVKESLPINLEES